MTTKLAKRSAASRKAWRTRKKMKAARRETPVWTTGWVSPAARRITFERVPDLPEDPIVTEVRRRLFTLEAKNRLPNPFLEIGERS